MVMPSHPGPLLIVLVDKRLSGLMCPNLSGGVGDAPPPGCDECHLRDCAVAGTSRKLRTRRVTPQRPLVGFGLSISSWSGAPDQARVEDRRFW